MKQALASLVSKKWSGLAVFLVAFVFSGLVFGGPLAAEKSETAPTVGLPADNETVLVDEALKKLPGQDVTAAVIVFRTTDGSAMTDAQKEWVIGEKTVFTPPFPPGAKPVITYTGGVAEKYLDYSNIELPNGDKFVPPATVSDDNTTAVVTVPMDKITKPAECKVDGKTQECSTVLLADQRVAAMRDLAKDGMPSGLETALTGPEGFLVDISNVFKGANFTLLGVTALVVMVLLIVTYRLPMVSPATLQRVLRSGSASTTSMVR